MNPNLQISFAGCGGMYHYYLGIAKIMQRELDLDNIVFSGSSGGCIPALLLLLGIDIDIIHYELNQEILKEVNAYKFGSLWIWNKIFRKHIHDFLDEDVHTKVDGKLFISITRFPSMKNEIISQWKDKQDLIDCIQASCFIPMAFEFRPWYIFRGNRYIDGAISNNMVVPLSTDSVPHIHIHTEKWRKANYNWIWCYTDRMWAEQLFKWGQEDALEHIEEFCKYTTRKS